MHLTFLASGIKQDMDVFEKFLETRWFHFPVTLPNGKVEQRLLQTQLRPIQLYDFVFPKEKLDVVLNTLQPQKKVEGYNTSGFQAHLWALRKAMKLKEIPNSDVKAGTFAMPLLNVRVVGIGIREDRDATFDNGETHEGV